MNNTVMVTAVEWSNHTLDSVYLLWGTVTVGTKSVIQICCPPLGKIRSLRHRVLKPWSDNSLRWAKTYTTKDGEDFLTGDCSADVFPVF